MQRFTLESAALDPQRLRADVADPACGGYVAFEGWVRDHNDGRAVQRLEYEAFAPLAQTEADRILQEAVSRFGVQHVRCAHRIGAIDIGDLAVWVGVSAAHRAEAFDACRYIIDQVKHRVPIWKKEYYRDGDSGWVNCEQCAAAAQSGAAHSHPHDHAHPHDVADEVRG